MTAEVLAQVMAQFPVTVEFETERYSVRPMTADDGPALLAFGQNMSPHDKLYMRRDITTQEGISQWLENLSDGTIYSLLAMDDQGVAGYSTIHRSRLEWTSHVADLRVATAERARRRGLGRFLAREAFNIALALDIEKLTARMTPDQRGARVLFEELGFTPEALLKDYVKDRDGNYHDMLLKGCSVQAFLAQRQAYGVGH